MQIKTKAEDKITYGEGITETQDFKIKASAQAFQILSSGLYSDKETAIIRELSANAVDAVNDRIKLLDGSAKSEENLKKRGIDKNWLESDPKVTYELSYPSMMSPEFVVSDYGIGLSEKDITELYTSYFSSSKDGDNENIGGFGLGSKSPFSYCESFTVESRFNGTLTIYSAMVGEGGTPKLSKLGVKPTTEKNGLTIKVPVKEQDFDAFQQKSRVIFSRFSEKDMPKITGNVFEIIKPEYNLKTQLYARRTPEYSQELYGKYGSKHTGTYIIMGNLSYPLEVSSISGYKENENMLGYFNKASLDIFLDIGSVSLSPTRESLSYDKQTSAFLLNVLEKFFEDIISESKKLVDLADSPSKLADTLEIIWASGRCRRIYDAINTYVKSLVKFTVKSPFNGYTFEYIVSRSDVSLPKAYALDKKTLDKIYKNWTRWKKGLTDSIDKTDSYYLQGLKKQGTLFRVEDSSRISRLYYTAISQSVSNISPDMRFFRERPDVSLRYPEESIVLIGNSVNSSKKKAKYWLNEYVQKNPNHTGLFLFFNNEKDIQILESLRKDLYKDSIFVYLKDVEIPKKAKGLYVKSKAKIQVFKTTRQSYHSDNFFVKEEKACQDILQEYKGSWVVKVQNRVIAGSLKALFENMSSIVSQYDKDATIIGVPVSRWDEVKDNDKSFKIINSTDDMMLWFEEILKAQGVDIKASLISQAIELSTQKLRLKELLEIFGSLEPRIKTLPEYKYVERIDQLMSRRMSTKVLSDTETRRLRYLAASYSNKIIESWEKEYADIPAIFKKARNKYPLLRPMLEFVPAKILSNTEIGKDFVDYMLKKN